MASKVEKLLLEIKADLKDLSTLKAELKNVRAEAEKSSKSASDALGSIGQVAGAIGAAFAGSKIVGFFRSAVDSANQLEASLSRVESAARAFGQSTAKAKDAALALSKDGFLSLNQSASALSNLLSTGLNIDQSKKFIEAAKNISAFGNTIGDAAGAVESGIKGIITGSTELVENMSPAMKTLSMRFTENKNKVGEAKAVQTLYNDVLKLGTRYAGDAAIYLDTAAAAQKRYEAATGTLAQTIGQKLQPAFKSIYDGAASIANGLATLLEKVSSTSVAFGALAVLAPVVGMAIAKAGAAAGLGFLSVLGPIGLVVSAIAGIAAIVTASVKTQAERQKDLVNSYKQTKTELDNLFAKIDSLSKINKRTADQERELATTKEALRKKAKELGVDYDNLALKVRNYADQLKYLEKEAKRKEIEKANSGINERIATRERIFEDYNADIAIAVQKRQAAIASGNSEALAAAESRIKFLQPRADYELQQIRELRKQRVGLPEESTDVTPVADSSSAVASTGKEARFIESQRKLEEIEKNRIFTVSKLEAQLRAEGFRKGTDEYEAELKRRRDAARADANDQAAGEKRRLQQVFAEYIEDEAKAKRNALEQQKQDAIRASKERLEIELAQAGQNEALVLDAKERHEQRLQKIREANARKEAQLRLESLNQTLQAANATTSGFAQMLRARDIGSALSGQGAFVSGLSGFKELFPALGALGPAGQAIGAVGGIVSTLTSLFGKSDEERAREAEAKRQRDEAAKLLLEQQAGYLKNMLAIQEAQARLPFENLPRDLRLIDIQAQQDILSGIPASEAESRRLQSRQSAISSVLASQSGSISGDALFGDFQPNAGSLTSFIKDRAAQAPYVAEFEYLLKNMMLYAQTWRLMDWIAEVEALQGKIPDELYSVALPFLNGLKARGGTPDNNPYFTGASDFAYISGSAGSLSLAPAELIGEIDRDTKTAEDLLGVYEQSLQAQLDIEKHTKATSENTAKLNLLDDRRRSFLDLGNRRIFSQGFNIDFQNLQLPQTIASTILAATPAPVLASDTVSELRKLVAIAEEQAELLAIIASNTDGRTATNSGDLDNYLIEKLKAIRSRRLS